MSEPREWTIYVCPECGWVEGIGGGGEPMCNGDPAILPDVHIWTLMEEVRVVERETPISTNT